MQNQTQEEYATRKVYRMYFNAENPPPGSKPEETIEQALARYRYTMMAKLPVIAPVGITIDTNQSIIGNGDLISRISNLTFWKMVSSKRYIINVAASEEYQNVISDQIESDEGEQAVTTPGVILTRLNPGAALKVYIDVEVGTAVTSGPQFNIVPIAFFSEEYEQDEHGEEMPTGEFIYTFEPIEGFTAIQDLLDKTEEIMLQDDMLLPPKVGSVSTRFMTGPTIEYVLEKL